MTRTTTTGLRAKRAARLAIAAWTVAVALTATIASAQTDNSQAALDARLRLLGIRPGSADRTSPLPEPTPPGLARHTAPAVREAPGAFQVLLKVRLVEVERRASGRTTDLGGRCAFHAVSGASGVYSSILTAGELEAAMQQLCGNNNWELQADVNEYTANGRGASFKACAASDMPDEEAGRRCVRLQLTSTVLYSDRVRLAVGRLSSGSGGYSVHPLCTMTLRQGQWLALVGLLAEKPQAASTWSLPLVGEVPGVSSILGSSPRTARDLVVLVAPEVIVPPQTPAVADRTERAEVTGYEASERPSDDAESDSLQPQPIVPRAAGGLAPSPGQAMLPQPEQSQFGQPQAVKAEATVRLRRATAPPAGLQSPIDLGVGEVAETAEAAAMPAEPSVDRTSASAGRFDLREGRSSRRTRHVAADTRQISVEMPADNESQEAEHVLLHDDQDDHAPTEQVSGALEDAQRFGGETAPRLMKQMIEAASPVAGAEQQPVGKEDDDAADDNADLDAPGQGGPGRGSAPLSFRQIKNRYRHRPVAAGRSIMARQAESTIALQVPAVNQPDKSPTAPDSSHSVPPGLTPRQFYQWKSGTFSN